MIRFRLIGQWVIAALAVSLFASPLSAQVAETEYEGSAALGLELRQLGTTKRVLMIGAHPDDERTQVLSTLALGEGADVAYLSLTRGEGGQNGIGPELQEALGLIRTEELLSARRVDGAQQFFTRAVDWGFSKNPEEAFMMWPRDELLADAVAVVRDFRPDVIVSVWSGTPADGHGHHQAAGIIAEDAFHAAADPDRYPEQIAAGLRPHAPIHFFRLVRRVDDAANAELATGEFDPLVGLSYFQIAMASRSRHRSQDMGSILRPGPETSPLTLAATRLETTPDAVFAGVDSTLVARARAIGTSAPGALTNALSRYQATLDDARRAFNPLRPQQIVPFLAEAARYVDEAHRLARVEGAGALDLLFHIEQERQEVENALLLAAGITVDAISEDEAVVPGQTFSMEVQAWNGGDAVVGLTTLEPSLPDGWTAVTTEDLSRTLAPGVLVTRTFQVTVPANANPTEPYFLQLPRDGARYTWSDEVGFVGVPFQRDAGRAVAGLEINDFALDTDIAATFQDVDQWRGEFRRPVRVVPAVSLTVEPGLTVLPIARGDEPIRMSVRLVAEEPDGIDGVLSFVAPAGWRVDPAQVPVSFPTAGTERVLEFSLFAPAGVDQDRVSVDAVFTDESDRRFDRGYTLVDYEHIRPRPIYSEAELDVQVLDVVLPEGLRVGYITSAGDNVPPALLELGVPLEFLDENDLASAPLDGFDVIVVGIRGYEGRPDLVTHNQRLLDYVEDGGTMIVQYNQYQFTAPGLAPYPISIDRPHDRVTDPTADVTLLEPDHPIFNTPNEITAADFEGWVQERGLYFLDTWDDRYTPLIEMADPGEEPNRGSLVIADVGEGTYVYTGLAFFRQFPAGVPGAYRLFANLLALGVDR